MAFRRTIWIALVTTVCAFLTAGAANASAIINPGYDLFQSLPGTTFSGVPFQGTDRALRFWRNNWRTGQCGPNDDQLWARTAAGIATWYVRFLFSTFSSTYEKEV